MIQTKQITGNGAAPNEVTYQPGGTEDPSNGIYTTFPAAWDAMIQVPNAWMNIDGSLGTPVVPPGTYAVPQQFRLNGLNFPALTFQDGAVFTSFPGGYTFYVYNLDLVNTATTTVPFTIGSGDFLSVYNFTAVLTSSSSATVPMIEFTGTGAAYMLHFGGAIVVGGGVGHPVFGNSGSATPLIAIAADTEFGANVLTGTGNWNVLQSDPSSSFNDSQPGANVTFAPAFQASNTGTFFVLNVTLVAGGPTTVASGKNLSRATLAGVYLVTPTTAVGVPQVTFVPGMNGNVTVESFGPGASKLATDASTYACVFAGAF
jgi:hypothetical protein